MKSSRTAIDQSIQSFLYSQSINLFQRLLLFGYLVEFRAGNYSASRDVPLKHRIARVTAIYIHFEPAVK